MLMLDDLAAAIARGAAAASGGPRLPHLSLISADRIPPPQNLLYEPMICFVAEGVKRLDVGAHAITAGRGDMMFNSLSTPVVATLEVVPYRSVVLYLDPQRVTDLLIELDETRPAAGTDPGGQNCALMPDRLLEAVTRWVQLLDTPEDIPALGHRFEAEILYRLLQSPLAPKIRQFTVADSAQSRIRAAAAWITMNFAERLRTSDIAHHAHMSVSTLHRQFKTATGLSPLSFQKQIRLQQARLLMASGHRTATQVAEEVGYATSTQFTREYTRFYGMPPSRHAATLRLQTTGAVPDPQGPGK